MAKTKGAAANNDQPRPLIINNEFNGSGESPPFAHPSEKEFAQILDFYGLRWVYEPLSFPLSWQDDKVVEMLTPDFYLPDLDLYVELTTMKQSLVTEKNRKLRHFREIYPDSNIRLLYRRDHHRILAKFGFGPLADAEVRGIDRVLFTARQVQRRVKVLGKQIPLDYKDRQTVLIGVLRGMLCFMTDQMREITLPVEVEFMAVTKYAGEGQSAVRLTKDLDQAITGRDIILVEDVVDSAMTLNYLLGHLRAQWPASLEVYTLLDKPARRLVDVPMRYIGFEVPDKLLVGYSLDFQEKYRNLPLIAVLRPEAKRIRP